MTYYREKHIAEEEEILKSIINIGVFLWIKEENL